MQNPADEGAIPAPTQALLHEVETIARRAGEAILAVYGTAFTVHGKADHSPVTEADERAEALITPALRQLAPSWPVVAEEAFSREGAAAPGPCFWLVDPLDGTREFVARNGEFTVNIALIVEGRPVLGVVHLPVPDRLFAGWVGVGAWQVRDGVRQPIRARPRPAAGAVVACSRSHGEGPVLEDWLRGQQVAARAPAGSSLKFGLLACGEADLYPRFGRTMEWDTAAGHAVLEAAGGSVCDVAGAPLRYGKPGFENPHFIARGALGSGG
ncbi:MAG: 3'(2'),5'-bisphosphate nucleotidase CysQ [Rubrivivax sp.]|nr:3'(2'),5'-bisphosphate nucleotidase CysQ [Rubrivivax sp.]